MQYYKIKAKQTCLYGGDYYVEMETNDLRLIPAILSGLNGYNDIEVKPFKDDKPYPMEIKGLYKNDKGEWEWHE